MFSIHPGAHLRDWSRDYTVQWNVDSKSIQFLKSQIELFFTSCAVRSLYYLELYNSSHLSHLHAFQVGTFNLINRKPISYKLFSETLFSRHLADRICEWHANELETSMRLALHLPWPTARKCSTTQNTITPNSSGQLDNLNQYPGQWGEKQIKQTLLLQYGGWVYTMCWGGMDEFSLSVAWIDTSFCLALCVEFCFKPVS